MSVTKITVKTTVDADLQKVWDAYTMPEHITQWNFADPSWQCPWAKNDMVVGGTYIARMEAKDGSFGFEFEAVYDEITPQKSFTYTFGGRQSTTIFEENGLQTTVTTTFEAETEHPVEMQRQGWQSILNNFKNYTESL
ncbi:MAG: SRPBCC domain-containing protein [Flavobacteriales bacterium]|nr:SRPBCC domain-containing protein [Flavobacteriales bacterium]